MFTSVNLCSISTTGMCVQGFIQGKGGGGTLGFPPRNLVGEEEHRKCLEVGVGSLAPRLLPHSSFYIHVGKSLGMRLGL